MTDGDKAKMVNIKEKIRQLVSDRDYLRMLLDQVSHLDFGFEDIQKAYLAVEKFRIRTGLSKMVRCKEVKKSRARGVLHIHERSGFIR